MNSGVFSKVFKVAKNVKMVAKLLLNTYKATSKHKGCLNTICVSKMVIFQEVGSPKEQGGIDVTIFSDFKR